MAPLCGEISCSLVFSQRSNYSWGLLKTPSNCLVFFLIRPAGTSAYCRSTRFRFARNKNSSQITENGFDSCAKVKLPFLGQLTQKQPFGCFSCPPSRNRSLQLQYGFRSEEHT